MEGTHVQEAAGAALGGLLGFIKSLTLISMITWMVVFETALLAAVGAVVGGVVAVLMKWIDKKIREWKPTAKKN